ncbi:MAG: MFS transporter [Acidimicrobiales bacterium]
MTASATNAARSEHTPVLRNRNFLVFFVAAVVSNSGTWMQQVAVFALIYDLSGHRGAWLGIVSLASALPMIVLTPVAGVLADRLPRRLILTVTQLVQAAAAFALWLLYLGDSLTSWRIVGLVFVGGIAGGFQMAAWQSFVPTLVPRPQLVEAVRLNSLQFTVSRALGPSVGALLVSFWGIGTAVFFNAVTYLLVVAAISVTHANQIIPVKGSRRFVTELVEGARYVMSNSILRLIILFAFFLSLSGQSIAAIAAAVAFRLYGHDAKDNAWLITALGVGALIMSVYVLLVASRFRRTVLTKAGIAIYALGLALIPLTTNFGVGLVGYGICGLAHVLVGTSLNTFVQASVPDEIRGRAMSFYLLGIMLGMPVGALLIGRVGDAVGFREVMVFNVIVFCVLTFWLTHVREYAQIDHDVISPVRAATVPQ